ncbi:DUF2071 domain-containing protein [Luteolibacter ambystomatis]|uniref:DUF2071 domain-containing protein n=1 Tax=Luteolibacter ambystomatis TaxID=2824561 RepID=A0A975J142_9BACT|nr:DUF2071 domain-containing protein [Luteolibacter ambystomatis]QUE52101.1 DUF2071 domain-containing protein [Luteolibacter ambystomatis]
MASVRTPLLSDRLAVREPPPGRAVMRQRWSRLLFLHWPVPAETLQSKLPPGLHVDTHDGVAWLGIVPFYMERIRPVALPPVPGVSWFLELNIRTYVHDDDGTPGIWFFSLDCNQPLAVEVARRFFHLPYQHALMSAEESNGRVRYHCQRETDGAQDAVFNYEICHTGSPADPDTLEFFLAERYLLYSVTADGSLFTGRVHHPPYRLAPVDCDEWSVEPARLDGLDLPETPPASILGAETMDVRIFPLMKKRPSR